jgi:hypothetical protein
MSKFAIDGVLISDGTFSIGKKALLSVSNVTTPAVFEFPNRSGTVALELPITIVTSNITAVAYNPYFVNTTSAAITVTLPAAAVQGEYISFSDYANTFSTNNLTIARNGHKIEGLADNLIVNITGFSFTLMYIDSTVGWKRISS